MSDKNRLGKGLGAIFGEDVSSVLEDIQSGANDNFGVKTSLKVKDIRTNPYQPRRHFDEVKLQELAESIKQHGLFTPILVRETGNGYELVAGERRLRATKLANLDEILAIIVSFNDTEMMEIALIENVQREDLNVIEEALGYKMMVDRLHLTQEDVAKKVSKSRSHVTNLMRLLKLPQPVQDLVQEQKLSMGHVRPLITLEDEKLMNELANIIVQKKMSARDAEKLVKSYTKEPQKTEKSETNPSDYRYAKQLFEKELQTRVTIDNHKIVIQFSDDEDLNRILEHLNLLED